MGLTQFNLFVMSEDTYFKWNREDDKTMYIDSVENAIDSLETTLMYFDRNDNLKWKWIVFSLHHSLYMFCTINLEGGNYTQVLSNGYDEDKNVHFTRGDGIVKKSKINKRPNSNGYEIGWEQIEKSWEELIEEWKLKDNSNRIVGRKHKLINFWTALARVQDGEHWMARYVHSKPITLTEDNWTSIEWITDEVRNQLTHFIPMGLSMPVLSLKKACFDIVSVIEQLAFYTGQVMYIDEGNKDRVKKSIEILKNKLS